MLQRARGTHCRMTAGVPTYRVAFFFPATVTFFPFRVRAFLFVFWPDVALAGWHQGDTRQEVRAHHGRAGRRGGGGPGSKKYRSSA